MDTTQKADTMPATHRTASRSMVAVLAAASLTVGLAPSAVSAPDRFPDEVPGTVTVSEESGGNDSNFAEAVSEEEQAELRAVMAERGIPRETQNELLDKIMSGELVDADRPDRTPVSERRVESDGEVMTELTFDDGSVALQSLVVGDVGDPGEVAPLSWSSSDCHVWHLDWQYTRYDNCRIGFDGISFSYAFRADVSLARDYNIPAVIRDVRYPTVHRAIGHSIVWNNMHLNRAWQDGGLPAEAVHSIGVEQNIPFGSTIEMRTVLHAHGSTISLFG